MNFPQAQDLGTLFENILLTLLAQLQCEVLKTSRIFSRIAGSAPFTVEGYWRLVMRTFGRKRELELLLSNRPSPMQLEIRLGPMESNETEIYSEGYTLASKSEVCGFQPQSRDLNTKSRLTLPVEN
ncbi:uncharacterized protein LOC144671341 isoform X1 [Cetorhinus maximus]